MNNSDIQEIDIYTDGSCHTQQLAGAWVAIILWDDEKVILSGTENNTTHNRMELLAVIEAIAYINKRFTMLNNIRIYSDSQYVTELPARKQKLETASFLSKKGTPVHNHLLLQLLFEKIDTNNLQFEKIKAHQKKNTVINYNIEADILCRKLLREIINNTIPL
ncbi:ribonuclease HI [soil metagenome]